MLPDSQLADLHGGVPPEFGEARFIARQPILDSAQNLYGYELLFRSGADIGFSDASGERAAQSTLDLSLLLGAESLTEGHRAFINFTRSTLCSGIVQALPRELVVLELLEDVPADEEIVRQCRRLKLAGYTIALDDIVSVDDRPALLELADIIKVDFLLTGERQQRALAHRFARGSVRMLAEKVETHEQFHAAKRMGYTLFQGYFFCRPETLRAQDLPSTQLGHLAILRKAHERELDIQGLAQVIRQEPSLVYRLLRYLNSAAWGVYPVTSVVQALNLLGDDEIRKWLSMAAAISLAGPRSQELIRMALMRARFCELIAEKMQAPTHDFFFTGLFSFLEAIMERPLAQIIELVPISQVCREALQGSANLPGTALRLAKEFECARWETIPELCSVLGCTEREAWRRQLEAQSWARLVLKLDVTQPTKA
jgi:EAL and modified HD-GYP domain-containing signal transduction protein